MEPTVMVIGIDPHSAPVEVRERFCIADRLTEALRKLSHAEGIAEVMLVSCAGRTDFILWASDASAASGSVLGFLTRDYGLQLTEWKHFYRKLDEAALVHVLLTVAGIDALAHGKECGDPFKEGSVAALQAGTLGRFLDSVVQHALAVSAELRKQANQNGPQGADDLARQDAKIFYAKLLRERVLPTIAALRKRLDDICIKELDAFYEGLASLSNEERELVESFAARLTQRIAGTLAHELKEPCEKIEQERLTAAVQRLFHLEPQLPHAVRQSPVLTR